MQTSGFSESSRDFLSSLLFPRTIRTNLSGSMLRILAMVSMLIDHFGKMCFPQIPEMRIIGRMAFPIYAYGIAVGAVHSRNLPRYLSRIVLLALISQPLYALGMGHEVPSMTAVPLFPNPLRAMVNFYLESWYYPSILLPLSLGLLMLMCIRQRRWILAIGVYVLCHRFSSSLDYGIQGIQLILILYFTLEHPLLQLLCAGLFLLNWSSGGGYHVFFGIGFRIQIYALPAVVLCALPMRRDFRLPRWLTYGFYPVHLAVLSVLTHL